MLQKDQMNFGLLSYNVQTESSHGHKVNIYLTQASALCLTSEDLSV